MAHERPITGGSATVLRVLLVGSAAAAALAVNHFVVHWVLFTDALLRRFLF